MKANAPEKIYLQQYDENTLICLNKWNVSEEWSNKPCNEKVATNIEYTRTDAFIEKTVEWLKESVTNNPECNRIMSKKGVITMGELIKDFKNYMKGEYGMDLKNLLEYYLFILNDQSLSYQDKVEVLEGKIKEQLEKM